MISHTPDLTLTHDKICFAFLDNGYGICETMKKTFPELLQRAFSMLFLKQTDAKLLRSTFKKSFAQRKQRALNREDAENDINRSRTGKKERGKGLPQIYFHARTNTINNLIVISNRGYVNLSNNTLQALEMNFKGTLLYFEYKRCSRGNNNGSS